LIHDQNLHRCIRRYGGSIERIRIAAGSFVFEGHLETELAPQTCAWFLNQLVFETKVIHARWSGEAVWTPLGDLESGLPAENHTVHPSRGDVLFYPGGISEAEMLLVYGSSVFASRAGQLAGNHFMTIDSGRDSLTDFGNYILWQGAQDILFSTVD